MLPETLVATLTLKLSDHNHLYLVVLMFFYAPSTLSIMHSIIDFIEYAASELPGAP